MKHLFKILVIALVILGMSVGLWFYLNKYLSRSKASGESASLKFSQSSAKANDGDIVRVDLSLTTASSTNSNSGVSAVDLSFKNTGGNLEFLYSKSVIPLPLGFDEGMQMSSQETINAGGASNGKQLDRIIFTSFKPASQLQKSFIIPLYFKVLGRGVSTTSSIVTIDAAKSLVVGPQNISYPVAIEASSSTFTVTINDPRAASASNLACDTDVNLSQAGCGRVIALKWTDSTNETGYKIYKNNQEIKTTSGNITTFKDPICANFNENVYKVIAFNRDGSVDTNGPSVSCACQVCPTAMPPTPTPRKPTNSADLIFRVVFPNVVASVSEIQNIKVTILNSDGSKVCDDDTNCAQVVTFTRVQNAVVKNTFSSPQLSYNLKKNKAYAVTVKQNHTVRQVFKNVYLRWMEVLQCVEGTNDSGCGDLLGGIAAKPLYSGDLDNSNSVDQKDADIVSTALGSKSPEGDLNFDGVTDNSDLDVLGKNFDKKGI